MRNKNQTIDEGYAILDRLTRAVDDLTEFSNSIADELDSYPADDTVSPKWLGAIVGAFDDLTIFSETAITDRVIRGVNRCKDALEKASTR